MNIQVDMAETEKNIINMYPLGILLNELLINFIKYAHQN